ncbi:MAG: universal stress protein [Desulfobulbaceae bacterium]|nr:universal stress protein [Desulfobulbaceae bacterium]
MERKILVAVDGSVYSSNSLDYLIRLFGSNPSISVDLLSIISTSGSDQNWMLDVDPLRENTPATERKICKAVKYLKDAQKRLLRNGFDKERVSFATQTTGGPAAIAIHQKVYKQGYDALLLGRRGMGVVGEMIFGSVSADLLNRCREVPVWIIDGEVSSNNYLLGVHGIIESLLAADHLAFMVNKSPNAKIYLYHSGAFLQKGVKVIREDFEMLWGKEWCEKYLDLDNDLIGAHLRLLVESGVEEERIIQLPTCSDFDPSHDLLRQARKHRCGTIVIGRRGRDVAKGMFKGVSHRTIQQAENVAVWLVG